MHVAKVLSNASRNLFSDVDDDLAAASSRHKQLHQLLRWMGLLDCSIAYSYFVPVCLLAHFANNIYLIRYEDSQRDAGDIDSDWLYYTSNLSHVLYEFFGLATYAALGRQLRDLHWDDGAVRHLGGFKQLVRADAAIFKFQLATSNREEILHDSEMRDSEEPEHRQEEHVGTGSTYIVNPAACDAEDVVFLQQDQKQKQKQKNKQKQQQQQTKPRGRATTHHAVKKSNVQVHKYRRIMSGLKQRVILFFVLNLALGVSWTIYQLTFSKRSELSPSYAMVAEVLYLVSRLLRQATIAVSAFLIVVLLRSHIQSTRELVMCMATSRWYVEEAGDHEDPASPRGANNNAGDQFSNHMVVACLAHSGGDGGAVWTKQSVADTLSQMLDRHLLLQRRVYDMSKSTAASFGLFAGFALVYFIVAVFQLGIVVERCRKDEEVDKVEAFIIQAQNAMLVDLTLRWVLPTATLVTREARKINKAASRSFAAVAMQPECSMRTQMQLQAAQRCFDNSPPVYQFNGSVVDNEFVQRSIAVLCATFFFTLNIWISDVYQ